MGAKRAIKVSYPAEGPETSASGPRAGVLLAGVHHPLPL